MKSARLESQITVFLMSQNIVILFLQIKVLLVLQNIYACLANYSFSSFADYSHLPPLTKYSLSHFVKFFLLFRKLQFL